MTESFIVRNTTGRTLSFRLDKACTGFIAEQSVYKQRKLIRAFSNYVAVPPQSSLDLVKAGDLTIAEIKASPEFMQVLNFGDNRLMVLYDSTLVAGGPSIDEQVGITKPVEVIEIPDPVTVEDEITEEEIEAEASDEIDPVTEEDEITEEELNEEIQTAEVKEAPKTKETPKISKKNRGRPKAKK